MSGECLICSKPTKKASTTTFFGATGQLCEQISVIFTVRKLLNVPKAVCEKLLKDLGSPSEWGISYCSKCVNNVEEAQFLSERLDHLQNKLNLLSSQIQTELLKNIEKLEERRDVTSKWKPIDEVRYQFSKWHMKTQETKAVDCDLVGEYFFGEDFNESSRDVENGDDFDDGNFEMSNDDNLDDDTDQLGEKEKVAKELKPISLNDSGTTERGCDSPEWQNPGQEDSDEEYKLRKSRRQISARGKLRRNKGRRGRPPLNPSENSLIPGVVVKVEVSDAAIIESANDPLLNFKTSDAERQLQMLQSQGAIRTRVASSFVSTDEIIHQCSYEGCKFKFKSQLARDAHEKRVHQGIRNPFNCEVCSNSFPRKCELEEHVKCHLPGSNVFLCHKCPWKFNSEIKRNAHIQRVHFGETRPYACGKCGMKFQRPVSLELHLQQRHRIVLKETISDTKRIALYKLKKDAGWKRPTVPKTNKHFKCTEPKCNFTFSTEISRDAHVQRFHHGVKMPYKCHLCLRSFARNSLLSEHLRKHESGELEPPVPKSFPCEQCGKNFKNRTRLMAHMSSKFHATGPKPYMCELCSKTFQSKLYLEQHQVRFHHKELNLKAVTCEFCGNEFATNVNLRHHIATVHKKEFKFKCPLCPAGFPYESQKNSHMRLHTKEKPFKCPHCPKAFPQRFYLTNHIRVHTGEKPWKCRTCHKSFSDKPTYNRHVESHEGNVHPCPQCSKTFTTRHAFRTHMKTHGSFENSVEDSQKNSKTLNSQFVNVESETRKSGIGSAQNNIANPPLIIDPFRANCPNANNNGYADESGRDNNDFSEMPQLVPMSNEKQFCPL